MWQWTIQMQGTCPGNIQSASDHDVIFNKENTFDMILVTEIWIVQTNWKLGFNLKTFGAF